MHRAGYVLPDKGDGLHWLKCIDCGREWAEKDSGAFARGSRTCVRDKSASEKKKCSSTTR